MNRMVVKTKVGNDGSLHLDLPVGLEEAGKEVQITVEPVPPAGKQRTMSAADLLHSGLVGMWADRMDIGDSREFARRLREQAQNRRRDP
ncbi:MAG TPA: hypothetical protein VH682_05355 [Gemmataceae bacterium]